LSPGIDHSGEAEKAGMKMKPTKLLENIIVAEVLAAKAVE
jgi:hypothetical protein